jgi:hypothetical protein
LQPFSAEEFTPLAHGSTDNSQFVRDFVIAQTLAAQQNDLGTLRKCLRNLWLAAPLLQDFAFSFAQSSRSALPIGIRPVYGIAPDLFNELVTQDT